MWLTCEATLTILSAKDIAVLRDTRSGNSTITLTASTTRGSRGQPVSWDVLTNDLAAKVQSIVAEHGADAVAIYYGTWSWMDALGRSRIERWVRQIGTRSIYSSTSVDAIARCTISELLSGTPSLLPSIDADDPGFTLLLGTNPVVSHGHAGALVDPITVMRRIARGPGLWVADPRRTETTRLANRHLSLRAGSDPALLAYLIRELLTDGADHSYIAKHVEGIERLRAAVEPWTLTRARGTLRA